MKDWQENIKDGDYLQGFHKKESIGNYWKVFWCKDKLCMMAKAQLPGTELKPLYVFMQHASEEVYIRSLNDCHVLDIRKVEPPTK